MGQRVAQWLAERLRLGVFPASYIDPRAIRGVRDALRRRQLFVRQRIQTMDKNWIFPPQVVDAPQAGGLDVGHSPFPA